MFGLRSDGVKVKDAEAIEKIIPHIMSKRSDAHNWCEVAMRCETVDNWINDVYERTGVSFNYLSVVIAGLVRLYATRPKLNRFVMNGRIFQRNAIYVSITIKASLRDDAPDLSLKVRFTGQESIFDVKEKVDNAINTMLKQQTNNKTTNTANALTRVPNCLIKFGVGLIKFLDKHGMLPKKIMDASPFHTSFYITNLKSIKGEWIYHHLYDFGTTGLFVGMGKEKLEPVVDDGKLAVGKVMRLGITMDERYCDGFYFIKTLKLWREFMADPKLLEAPLDIEPVESKKERKKRLKAEKKQKKAAEKGKQ